VNGRVAFGVPSSLIGVSCLTKAELPGAGHDTEAPNGLGAFVFTA